MFYENRKWSEPKKLDCDSFHGFSALEYRSHYGQCTIFLFCGIHISEANKQSCKGGERIILFIFIATYSEPIIQVCRARDFASLEIWRERAGLSNFATGQKTV